MSKWFKHFAGIIALLSAVAAPMVSAADVTPSSESLIATMQSQANPEQKWVAAQLLARIGNSAIVPKLVAALSDPEQSDLARFVLETIPGSEVDDALRQILPSLKGTQLAGAITSLGVRRDSKSVEPIAKYVHDSEPTISSAAVSALGRIGNPAAAKVLVEAAGNASAPAKLEIYSAMLACANTMRTNGDANAAIELCKQIRSANLPASFRSGAVQCAILADAQGGIAVLKQALQDPDAAAFNSVLYLFQRDLPQPAVTLALTTATASLPVPRQLLAIPVISLRGGNDALSALSELSTSAKDKSVRIAAVRSLAPFADAAQVLSRLAGDSDADLSKAAQETLSSLPGSPADQVILSMLNGSDASSRILGAQLAARRRLHAAVPALLTLAADASVGSPALSAIREIAGDSDLPGVLGLFGKIPAASVEGILVAIGDRADHPEQCGEAIAAKLPTLDVQNKCAALRALANAGGSKALEANRSFASDPNAEVKRAAVQSLTQWKTAAAALVLIDLAKASTDPAEKSTYVRGALSLAGIEDTPAADCLTICRSAVTLASGVDEKKLLLSALGTLPMAEAIELISPYLDDPATRAEAASAVLAVAGRVLQGPQPAIGFESIVAASSKIVQTPPSAELGNRAKAILDQATKARGTKPAAPVGAKVRTPPFFPFCIDWHDSKKRSFAEQAVMLKELGYDGVGHIWLDGVAERLKTLDDAKLKLYQITMTVDLTPGKAPYDPKFKDVLSLVKGRAVQFDLLINGAAPSDSAAEAHGVEVLREMSDLAHDSGAQLLLYPHVGCWVERIEDSCRIAEKVDRPNVGVMFNLCHWLRVDKQRDYKPLLQKAMPRLWAVSINGADELDPNPGWDHYIQPLGQGSFDMATFLKTLNELGYKGPIGLQCYGIGGDTHDHLAKSMDAWRKLNGK